MKKEKLPELNRALTISDEAIEATMARKATFIREAFAFMDTDGGGGLNAEEITSMCSVIDLKLSNEEIQDIVNEHDADGSGQLEVEEFIQLVLSRGVKPETEMRETWNVFDTDASGCITAEELKSGLERVGIRLAPWELRQMVEVADVNKDHVISYEEFVDAYGKTEWIRAQGVCGLMTQIMATWKLLDVNDDGAVSVNELVKALVPFGESEEKVAQMINVADENGNGTVSFKEFLHAYHSKDWFKVQLVNMAGHTIEHAKEEQDKLYRHLKSEERDAGGSDSVKKTDLMKRRALRRAKAVRVAINKFWQAIEFYTIKYAWVPKDLYTTYNIKLQLVVFADDDEEEIAEAELADMSKEDWQLDLRKKGSNSKTKSMVAREKKGMPPMSPRPGNVDVISYAVFYDSMFELADAMIGREQGVVDADKYADCIEELTSQIVKKDTNENGEAEYSWVNDDHVYLQKGQPKWGVLAEPDLSGMADADHGVMPRSESSLDEVGEAIEEDVGESKFAQKIACRKLQKIGHGAMAASALADVAAEAHQYKQREDSLEVAPSVQTLPVPQSKSRRGSVAPNKSRRASMVRRKSLANPDNNNAKAAVQSLKAESRRVSEIAVKAEDPELVQSGSGLDRCAALHNTMRRTLVDPLLDPIAQRLKVAQIALQAAEATGDLAAIAVAKASLKTLQLEAPSEADAPGEVQEELPDNADEPPSSSEGWRVEESAIEKEVRQMRERSKGLGMTESSFYSDVSDEDGLSDADNVEDGEYSYERRLMNSGAIEENIADDSEPEYREDNYVHPIDEVKSSDEDSSDEDEEETTHPQVVARNKKPVSKDPVFQERPSTPMPILLNAPMQVEKKEKKAGPPPRLYKHLQVDGSDDPLWLQKLKELRLQDRTMWLANHRAAALNKGNRYDGSVSAKSYAEFVSSERRAFRIQKNKEKAHTMSMLEVRRAIVKRKERHVEAKPRHLDALTLTKKFSEKMMWKPKVLNHSGLWLGRNARSLPNKKMQTL